MHRRKYYGTKNARTNAMRYQVPSGEVILLYPISYLAASVDRSISCIDSWVRRGILPQTPFKRKGYKYYSQEQIDLIASIVRSFNIRAAVPLPQNFSVVLKQELDNLFSSYGVYSTVEVCEESATLKDLTTKSERKMKPLRYELPTGEIVLLHTIGELARKLNRDAQVIKKWELSGALPKTPFKTKSKFRLYTQDQINIVAKCAEKFNIRNGVSIKASGFTDAVITGFNTLYVNYGLMRKT